LDPLYLRESLIYEPVQLLVQLDVGGLNLPALGLQSFDNLKLPLLSLKHGFYLRG
jgi:hypothetical protein